MTHLKMTFDFYEDVKRVGEAIAYLHAMCDTLEQECIHRDKGKTATDVFIHINNLKREMEKMTSENERLQRAADIQRFGPLSKYVRPYLGY